MVHVIGKGEGGKKKRPFFSDSAWDVAPNNLLTGPKALTVIGPCLMDYQHRKAVVSLLSLLSQHLHHKMCGWRQLALFLFVCLGWQGAHSLKRDLGTSDQAGTAPSHLRALWAFKLHFSRFSHLMNSRYFGDVNKLCLAACLGERMDAVYLELKR